METERSPGRSIRVLAGALGLIAMVLPRLPRIRPHDTVAGVIPVGPFSGGLLDGNTLLMSVLLVASAGIMTGLRPARAWESAWILGLAPTAWMVIVMMWHGPGDIWPVALVVAAGYGVGMAMLGVILGRCVAWLVSTGRPPRPA
jgi:hypothetical protein